VIRLMGEAEVVGGLAQRVFGITQDITERKRVEERNWRLANHDFLTRLPNRRLFEEAVERAIEVARADGSRVGLLVVHLDYFREINASLGYEVGDVMLHVIAGRLRRLAGHGDEVARVGGDEFAVLVRNPRDGAKLVSLARKMLKAIEQPVMIRDREVACRASVGGALFPDHARSCSDLVNRANAALDRAKTTGRRIAVVYDEEMQRESDTRFRVHESIRGALGRDEIFPYYQPKVSLRTGEVLGLEALVRWRSGPGGVVVPAEFGAALADGFLGSAIGTRVIEKVTDDIRAWLDAGLPFGSVAVNASAMELMRGAYHERVSEVLSRKQIPFDRFQVEVTETVFVQHEGHEIRETVRRLDAMGVRVALDDFGTGFGSLVHLRRLAVSQIKIDRSFIAGIETDAEDLLIVKALVELGQGLGKTVIAEGIERESERRVLIDLGCEVGQGYLFGLPLPTIETTHLLERERARASRG
jgi:diguanylate cyclase (GGDEF)-like protein